MTLTPFHIAFPVDDFDAARTFYGTTLGCPEGCSSAQWVDFISSAIRSSRTSGSSLRSAFAAQASPSSSNPTSASRGEVGEPFSTPPEMRSSSRHSPTSANSSQSQVE